MNETKTCKQCGEIKPLDQFRPYYKGKGYYSICKGCESINTRAKYLSGKEHLSKHETEELKKIHDLYELQRGLGLKPPTFKAHKWGSVTGQLDTLLEKYGAKYIEMQQATAGLVDDGVVVPYDLVRWLTEPLDKTPEYYDKIYDLLVATYKPIKHVTNDDFTPVYDLTFAKVLDKILHRFDDYSDSYDYSNTEQE